MTLANIKSTKRRNRMIKGNITNSEHLAIRPTSKSRGTLSLTWRRVRWIATCLFALAVISRLSYLGVRTFHHDESLDAWFSLQYLDGTYKGYDPHLLFSGCLASQIVSHAFFLQFRV